MIKNAFVAAAIVLCYFFAASAAAASEPPVITSGPTATPASGVVGTQIDFSIAATSPGGLALTYRWFFGDNSTTPGASVSHKYAKAGTFKVNVAVTDTDQNVTTSSIFVQISDPAVGSGADSDGDGFSDTFENEVATDPQNPSSTPFFDNVATTANVIGPIEIKSVSLKFYLDGAKPDSMTVSANLIGNQVPLSGDPFLVNVTGVAIKGTLTKYNFKDSNSMVKLAADKKPKKAALARGLTADQRRGLRAFKRGIAIMNGFHALVRPLGRGVRAAGSSVRAAPTHTLDLVMTVIFPDGIYTSPMYLDYTLSKDGKTATARLRKVL